MKKFQDRENYGKLWNSSGLVSYVYEKYFLKVVKQNLYIISHFTYFFKTS